MPNPMNTFLWRYLADQQAKKVRESEEGRWLAEQNVRQADVRDKQDLEHGTALGQLGQELGPDASPALLRGHTVGRAGVEVERAKQQAAMRQALGMEELKQGYSTDLKLQEGADRRDSERLQREHELELERMRLRAKQNDPSKELALELTRSRFDEQAAKAQDARMRDLDTKLGDIPPVDDLKYAAELAISKGDMPGAGRFDAPMTRLGLGSAEDDRSLQTMQRLHNTYLKLQSGAAVTPSEADRAAIASGMNLMATEQQRRAGMQALLRNIRQGSINIQTRARPGDIALRKQRGGTIADDIPDIDSMVKVRVQKADGTRGSVPAKNLQAFLEANPGAKALE